MIYNEIAFQILNSFFGVMLLLVMVALALDWIFTVSDS